MKWEQYSQLNNEQKEEYSYKFKDTLPKAPFQSWIMTTAILWLVFGTVILSTYISLTSTDPALVKLQPMLNSALEKFATGINLFTTIFIAYLVIWTAKLAWWIYSERKWLKENGKQA